MLSIYTQTIKAQPTHCGANNRSKGGLEVRVTVRVRVGVRGRVRVRARARV